MRPPPGSGPRAWSDGLYTAMVGSDRPGASVIARAGSIGRPVRLETATPDDLPALLLRAESAVPAHMHTEKA